jgi:peptidyl-prolyl cis-trans isomerase C
MSLVGGSSNRSLPTAGLLLAALFLAALIGGCSNDVPKGQVIAVVNGEEITIAELNEEARVRGLAIGADPVARQALLQELIDRKLLVQAARQEQLDRTPEHLLASRRASELALAQQLVAKRAGKVGRLTGEQLQQLVRENPHVFGARAMLSVHQVTFDVPQGSTLGSIQTADSLAALKAELTTRKIPFSESRDNWDTASLDRRWADRLLSTEPGSALLFMPSDRRMTVVQILAKEPKPVPGEQAELTALELLRNQRAQEVAARSLAAAREVSEVQIQPGF